MLFRSCASQLFNQKALKLNLSPDAEISLKDIEIKDLETSEYEVVTFIGPEGGLNNEEIKLLENNQFKNICFGPRILRTETAGPAVISALQILWGDF